MANYSDKYKIYRAYYSKDSGQTWVEYDKFAWVLDEKSSKDCKDTNSVLVGYSPNYGDNNYHNFEVIHEVGGNVHNVSVADNSPYSVDVGYWQKGEGNQGIQVHKPYKDYIPLPLPSNGRYTVPTRNNPFRLDIALEDSTYIPSNMFTGITHITGISLPKTIERIGAGAFVIDTPVYDYYPIYLNGKPPVLEGKIGKGHQYFVPEEYYNDYKNSPYWKGYVVHTKDN